MALARPIVHESPTAVDCGPRLLRRDLALTPAEASSAAEISREIARAFASSDNAQLLRSAQVLAQRLPSRLRDYLCAERFDDNFEVLLISGHEVDDRSVGPTPGHWKEPGATDRSLAHEILALLQGSLLGEAFGWFTQQRGHIVTDLVPMRGLETQQVGAGSQVELEWHTEDAFHAARADYLLLSCLRNPYRVATSVATLTSALANSTPSPALFRPCVTIMPDDAHLAGLSNVARDTEYEPRPSWIDPGPVAVLQGDPENPYLCIDPAYMKTVPGDEEGAAAVAELCGALEASLVDVVLEPGDVLIVDNRKAVHGRRSFTPRYDGSDRWLKRVNLSRAFDRRYCVESCSNQRVVL